MGSDVDHAARLTANKTLTIFFIIIILLASVCPIVSFLRRNGLSLDVWKLYIITLTLGGFLLALFPLVVKARLLFDFKAHARAACDIPIMAAVYESFYYPFVYSMGLILMAVHLIVQQRTTYLQDLSPFSSLLLLASPWLLGLILVLPIMLAGIHWEENCEQDFTKARIVAQTWLCNLLPVIGVLAAGVAVLVCVKTGTRSHDSNTSGSQYQVIFVNSPQEEVIMSTTESLHRVGSRERSRNSDRASRYSIQSTTTVPSLQFEPERPVPTYHCRGQQHPYLAPIHSSVPYPCCGNPHHCPSHYFMTQCYDTLHHSHPRPIPTAPLLHHHHHHHHPPPLPLTSPPPSINPPPVPPRSGAVSGNTTSGPRDSEANDKKVFVTAAVMFFVCSFPAPVFNLGYFLNDDRLPMDLFSMKIITDFVYWFTVVRWVVLPLCWTFWK